MCSSLNCIGWRVKSDSILRRVVAGMERKFDEFVCIYNYEFLIHNGFETKHKNL